jgi:UDP:flavonoid glycosyltransferase YjiC (YdhE family)
MANEARRGAIAIAEGGLAAARDTDLILAGIGGLFVGLALAEKFGLPVVQAYYIPFTPTRAFPSFMFPRLPTWLGGPANRFTFHLARQVMWQGFRSADAVARRQVFDLPPAPLWGPFGSDRLRDTPVLYGYSPHVIPPPPDWGADTSVVGYWFLDPPSGWTPPLALLDFVAAGPPPVYVGFGSMSSRNPQATAKLVLDALGAAGQRAVLLAGWSGLRPADLPDSVLMVDSVPFAWLFPRMAAVVHHGGAGTTGAGLRAGVPSIVVPFFGDQPYWGRRVAELGVGPAPIPRKRLTVEVLAGAIDRAVTDPVLRRRAAELGTKIRAEDGVARAVAVVNTLASGS